MTYIDIINLFTYWDLETDLLIETTYDDIITDLYS